jgi:FMN-dependent NADH-azoreductase
LGVGRHHHVLGVLDRANVKYDYTQRTSVKMLKTKKVFNLDARGDSGV